MDSILSFLVPIILVVLVLLVLAANVRWSRSPAHSSLNAWAPFRACGAWACTSRSRSLSGLQRMFP